MASFDHSRMALIDVRGRSRPPYIVLTSQQLLDERPGLAPYQVAGEDHYTAWGGNDPPALYLSFESEGDLHRLAGNPSPTPPDSAMLDSSGFDPATFDSDAFETGAHESGEQASSSYQVAHSSNGLADGALPVVRVTPLEWHAEASDKMEAHGKVGLPPAFRFRAMEVTSSSEWTGRRSPREQVTVVRSLAPLALDSVALLLSAVEERRLNDPATNEALQRLRELRDVLGELIDLAERERPLHAVWTRLESAKEKVTDALWNGAQVMVVAPVLALGSASILSYLSGIPVSDGMVTALCATSMSREAVMTIARRQ